MNIDFIAPTFDNGRSEQCEMPVQYHFELIAQQFQKFGRPFNIGKENS